MPMKPSLVCLCAALVITISRSSLADDVDVLYDVDDLAMTSVHVTGNRRGVTLEAPIDGEWKTLCNAPCDLLVPFGQYRLVGTGLRPTNVVELHGEPVKRLVERSHQVALRAVGQLLAARVLPFAP